MHSTPRVSTIFFLIYFFALFKKALRTVELYLHTLYNLQLILPACLPCQCPLCSFLSTSDHFFFFLRIARIRLFFCGTTRHSAIFKVLRYYARKRHNAKKSRVSATETYCMTQCIKNWKRSKMIL